MLAEPAAGSAAGAPDHVTTIGQAYYCIFAHYYAGPVLDDRVLLAGAFAGFTQELDQLGLDQPDATMPALTGHRDSDWAAFAAVYQKVTRQLRQPGQAAGDRRPHHDRHGRQPGQQPRRGPNPAPPPGTCPATSAS